MIQLAQKLLVAQPLKSPPLLLRNTSKWHLALFYLVTDRKLLELHTRKSSAQIRAGINKLQAEHLPHRCHAASPISPTLPQLFMQIRGGISRRDGGMMPHPSEASRVPDTASLIDNHRHRATALHPPTPPPPRPRCRAQLPSLRRVI